MPRNKTAGNLALANFGDIFNVAEINNEGITQIPICDLYPPEFHPFQVNDDEAMNRLTESVKQYGVREPGVARPRASGGYELLCGNRRKRACELAGINTMPIIVNELGDNDAAIVMVESNLQQREKLLHSERAWAYRVMMEALNHNGVKSESHSYELIVERTGIKKSQLFRIIRLTELITALSDRVDSNKLALNPAVELSYLSVQEQTAVVDAMERHETKPSLSQAVRLKKMKKDNKLTAEIIDAVLSEVKKPTESKESENAKYRKFFPSDYSQKQIDGIIIGLLEEWKAKAAV
jgi:ParB family chromosome partitioning protein